MMTFISCAKTMTARTKIKFPETTVPPFQKEARENALYMNQFTAEELGRMLKVNAKLAAENRLRYQDFLSPDTPSLPALLAYTGMVFKRIHPADFTPEDFQFAQQHLLITSFLYGLLRPLDAIRNYRMEGNVRLPEHQHQTQFDYWKPILTDYFIEAIRRQGNILVNLASGEMKDLFHWDKICREVQVITPEFYTLKNGKPTTVVVYAKMCRGEMTRFILKNRIEQPEQLKAFEWEGFSYDAASSNAQTLRFLLK